ncbi:MAG: hypothetical protein AAGJ35_10095 [Myxococcota bacterium]
MTLSPKQFFFKQVSQWMRDVFTPPHWIEEVCIDIQFEFDAPTQTKFFITLDLGDYNVQEGYSHTPTLWYKTTPQTWESLCPLWWPALQHRIQSSGSFELYLIALQNQADTQRWPIPHLTEEDLASLQQQPVCFSIVIHNPQTKHRISIGCFCNPNTHLPAFQVNISEATLNKIAKLECSPWDAWKKGQITLQGQLSKARPLLSLFNF